MEFQKAKLILLRFLTEISNSFTDTDLVGNIMTCHTTGSFNVDICGNILNFKPYQGCSLNDFIRDDVVDPVPLPKEEFDSWYELHTFLTESFSISLHGGIEIHTRRNIAYMFDGTDYQQFEITGF